MRGSTGGGKAAMTLGGALTGVTAAVAAVVVGLTPTVSSVPQLAAATVTYLRGTNIGWTPTDAEYRAFIGRVLDGTGTPSDPPTPAGNVDYNAGFWPVSHGLIFDLTWNDSVAQGVANLDARNPTGNVVFGLSQGAVVASQYKAEHPGGTGNTFVLVENPSRPNGGVLARFNGLHIPILNVTFSGATPDNGDPTIDVARQYDGWADFPTRPLNLLATANAVLGMIYIHGRTQTELTAADLAAAKASGDSMYYQQHSNTTYYLVRTPRLPLLMPLTGVLPESLLNSWDSALRPIIEQGYDRTDYNRPTQAQWVPPAGSAAVANPPAVASPAQAIRSAVQNARTARTAKPAATTAHAPKPAAADSTPSAGQAPGHSAGARTTGGSARAARAD
ncbi:PE-PPE domain-containing protein [Mycobacterium sp. DL592]|uniref:PE-PPE domain-containing protein n=1 Tax=Mycobacterium sp. DL592 TaxID=2675524 RepID=UPI001421FBE8|nr:PE-PPE domain-containing protein [Mycobacterium sp. DL592]